MRRLNLIIGKKQLIIAGLTLVLGVAVYANFAVSSGVEAKPEAQNSEQVGNYGELQFVNDEPTLDVEGENTLQVGENVPLSKTPEDDGYFAQARLDRDESRAKAVDILRSVYAGGDSTETELAVLAQDTATICGYVESESKIENILKAQGFSDVLCYLSDNGANIIVKTDGLEKEQAAQIKNALLSEVKIPAEKITIIEKK